MQLSEICQALGIPSPTTYRFTTVNGTEEEGIAPEEFERVLRAVVDADDAGKVPAGLRVVAANARKMLRELENDGRRRIAN